MMSDRTGPGLTGGTKTTKKGTTIVSNHLVFVIFVFCVALVAERAPSAVPLTAQQAGQQPPTQAQQRPVFRGGTHFVRVDAYPTLNGKIVEGLKPEDFEIFEDGKAQTIESFDFIKFDTFTPDAERHDPSSQRAGFDLAADPRYRVFVVYVDMALSRSAGAFSSIDNVPNVQQPLVDFFERVVGPHDLYGFLTTRNSVKDLVLAQKTTVTVSQIKDLWRANVIDRDDADEAVGFCPYSEPQIEHLKLLFRADASYTNLMGLVAQLGSLRQERKNLVLATNLLPRWLADRAFLESLANSRQGAIPRTGIERGKVTTDNREVLTNNPAGDSACFSEAQRLALMDFEPRYRELVAAARRENVSFYTITPGGLQAPVTVGGQRAVTRAYDDLKSLSDETDGLAVTNTNDLNAGFRRIADDLAAYYLLGYYTTNTKFDGGVRKITVKTKSNGKAIRARREYRAPTEKEIAAMANPAPAAASVETGPPAVIGEPTAYRVSRAEGAQKVSLLEFVRADRIRVQWPVLAPLERREARMLDSAGKPLPFDLPVSEDEASKTVLVELPLAPFSRGTYAIELTAGSGGKTERRRLTFMMK
jgi:VWFA-related protein